MPSKRSIRFSQDDRRYMTMALSLAKRGQGRVEPNPMVGCVIVKNDRVISTGWHRKFGGGHAEANALREAGKRAKGATVYVTLEPCCFFGKTPPCSEALVAAQVGRVVVACRDPNPKVAGKGITGLRKAGIAVETGLMRSEASEVIAPFRTLIEKGRPYVIAKWAQSLDGKIATAGGDSKWISGERARKIVHQLRGRVDGVIVGSRTARIDDPLLTARDVRPKRIAARIVFDSNLSIKSSAQLIQSARTVSTIVITTQAALRTKSARVRTLEAKGVQVIACKSNAGRVNVADALKRLGMLGMTNVLVEGGGALVGAFADSVLIDEAHVFTSPLLIGGSGQTGCHGTGVSRVGDATRGDVVRHRLIDGDQYAVVRFRNPAS